MMNETSENMLIPVNMNEYNEMIVKYEAEIYKLNEIIKLYQIALRKKDDPTFLDKIKIYDEIKKYEDEQLKKEKQKEQVLIKKKIDKFKKTEKFKEFKKELIGQMKDEISEMGVIYHMNTKCGKNIAKPPINLKQYMEMIYEIENNKSKLDYSPYFPLISDSRNKILTYFRN